MAYDLEEQEQIDAFKTWWKENGTKILIFVGVAIIALVGMEGWKYYQNKQAVEASVQFQQLMEADPKDIKVVQALSAQLMENYSTTPYAGRAAMIAAKANYNANDLKSAKAQLEWAITNAKEEQVRTLARLQLAALQLNEKDYDKALQTLSAKHDEGFAGLYADLKGDILAAQGKKEEARTAYKEALTKLDPQGRYRSYTEHKLEALGG